MKKKNRGIFFVGVALIAMVMACNYVTPQKIPTPQQKSTSPVPVFPTENPYLQIPRVTLEDAKTALDNGTAVFVDVRGTDAYKADHIPGALSIPGSEIENRLNELDPKKWIIPYCT